MRILLVTYAFPPGGGGGVFRTAKFVKYAVRSGCAVTVLTVSPRFYCRAQDARDPSMDREVAGARVLRTPRIPLSLSEFRAVLSPPGPRSQATSPAQAGSPRSTLLQRVAGVLSFPDQEVGWVPFALVGGLDAIRRLRIDVVYSSAPPASAHLVGCALASITGKPLVAEFRDPWAALDERPGGRSFGSGSFRRRWEIDLEARVLKRARRIIVVNDALRALYDQAYPSLSPGRTIVVPNGFDPEDFEQPPTSAPPDMFTITFTGSLYGNHGPTTFLRGLKRFLAMHEPARSRTLFRVAGSLDRRAGAEIRDAQAAGLVDFLGYVEHARALDLMRTSSVLLLTLPDSAVAPYWMPAKTYEYLATDRPILAVIPEGELRRVLSIHRGVVIVDPGDEAGIAAALARLFVGWESGDAGMKALRREGVPTRPATTAAILRVLEEARFLRQ